MNFQFTSLKPVTVSEPEEGEDRLSTPASPDNDCAKLEEGGIQSTGVSSTASSDKLLSSNKTFSQTVAEYISISSKRFVDNEVGVDSEYAWIVDIACFFVQFFVIGNFFSFGVFLPVYVDYFHSDQQATAWIGSVGSFLSSFLGILSGALSDRIGNDKVIALSGILLGLGFFSASFATQLWHLYLTQGIIVGIGYSCGFISSVAVTGQWFKRYRGLAVGITMGGAGMGQFAMSQIIGKLIAVVGWRSTLRYLALINFVPLVLISFIVKRRLPLSRHFLNIKNESEFLQNRNFLFLTFGYTVFIFGMLIPYTFLVIYSQKHDLSVTKSVLIFSLMGIANGIGRMTFGEIADLSIGRLPMLKLSMTLGGVATLCWVSCKTFSSLLAYGLIYAFVAGGSVSIVPSAAADIFGVKKISSFLGVLFSIAAFGNLLSSPIAGLLSDSYDSYTPAIILSGVAQITGACLLCFMRKENDPEFLENSGKPTKVATEEPVEKPIHPPRVVTGDVEEAYIEESEVELELTIFKETRLQENQQEQPQVLKQETRQ
jgi:MFS family permease